MLVKESYVQEHVDNCGFQDIKWKAILIANAWKIVWLKGRNKNHWIKDDKSTHFDNDNFMPLNLNFTIKRAETTKVNRKANKDFAKCCGGSIKYMPLSNQ